MQRFMLLISLSQANAGTAKAVLSNLMRLVDASARAQWIDSRGAGIFVATTLTAQGVWTAALSDLPSQQQQTLRDMLVLQIGPDCTGWQESRAMAWLGSHRQQPAP